jgi:hypothetical protein
MCIPPVYKSVIYIIRGRLGCILMLLKYIQRRVWISKSFGSGEWHRIPNVVADMFFSVAKASSVASFGFFSCTWFFEHTSLKYNFSTIDFLVTC